MVAHAKGCAAGQATCSKCNKIGHYAKVCRNPTVNEVSEIDEGVEDKPLYNANVFKLTQSDLQSNLMFKMVIKNRFDRILADTGAAV